MIKKQKTACCNLLSSLNRYKILFFLIFIFLILRIPSLFEPNRYADEDIYLTMGQGLRKGLIFYKEIHDNKPPFLYLTAALAGNIFWFKFILLIVSTAGVVFFWKLAELIFRENKTAVWVSTIIFGLYSTLPTLEGNVANGENFMIVPAITAVYLIYKNISDAKNSYHPGLFFIIGLLFSTSFLFKIPIVFDFIGILLFWLVFAKQKIEIIKTIKEIFSLKILLVLAGFLLPIIASIIYYSFNDAFEPYVRSALMQNIGYLSSWGESGGGTLFSNPLIWRGLIVAGILFLITVFASKLNLESRLLLIWTPFSMYGALLSNRPYPHYLLEPLVPVALLIPLIFSQKKWSGRILGMGILFLIWMAYDKTDYWKYETVAYYQNFTDFVLQKKDWNEYLDFWGARQNYEIAEYLKEKKGEEKYLFIWGTEPAVYALTDLLPIGRYTVAYHIVDFNAYQDTFRALSENSPKYIVIYDNSPDFSEFEKWVETHYVSEKRFPTAAVYKKLQ